MKIDIPGYNCNNNEIILEKGNPLIVLGANGSGKSSFIYSNVEKVRAAGELVLISAQRNMSFDSKRIEMQSNEYEITQSILKSYFNGNEHRWKKTSDIFCKLPIYKMKRAVNLRNACIAKRVDAGDTTVLKFPDEDPIASVNDILEMSNMFVRIEQNSDGDISVLNKRNNKEARYSLSEMSDGEKNAIMIAFDIVSAKKNSVLLIDEPERHLHRSISLPLLTSLARKRTDCYLIISTHDIEFASNLDSSSILILKSCNYDNGSAIGWDHVLINNPEEIPDDIKKDILGTKGNIVFIEGTSASMDAPLYQATFNNVNFVSKAGCEEVISAVRGVKELQNIEWISAFGVVDNDNKTQEEIEKLEENNIFVLKYNSIESVYYHPRMIELFVKNYSDFLGIDNSVLTDIKNIFMKKFRENDKKTNLCNLAIIKKIRFIFNSKAPNSKDGFRNISIDIPAGDILEQEYLKYEEFVKEEDYKSLIENYSMKRLGALNEVVKKLNCISRSFYESKVVLMANKDEEVRNFVRESLNGLTQYIS